MTNSITRDESVVIDEILASCRDSSAPPTTWGKLSKQWQALARASYDYQFSIYDYANDLSSRDTIEMVVNEASEDLRAKLIEATEAVDEFFKASTREVSSPLPGAPADAGWWWRRVPCDLSGELRHDLDGVDLS